VAEGYQEAFEGHSGAEGTAQPAVVSAEPDQAQLPAVGLVLPWLSLPAAAHRRQRVVVTFRGPTLATQKMELSRCAGRSGEGISVYFTIWRRLRIHPFNLPLGHVVFSPPAPDVRADETHFTSISIARTLFKGFIVRTFIYLSFNLARFSTVHVGHTVM
jgi:hypothetical protein